jgi:hypothetical protein
MTDIFHTMIVVLCCVARRWTIARGILKMIWITINQHQLQHILDVNTVSLFKLSMTENRGTHERRILEACAYPNYSALGEKSRVLVEMGDLLQEYAAMQISSDGYQELTKDSNAVEAQAGSASSSENSHEAP